MFPHYCIFKGKTFCRVSPLNRKFCCDYRHEKMTDTTVWIFFELIIFFDQHVTRLQWSHYRRIILSINFWKDTHFQNPFSFLYKNIYFSNIIYGNYRNQYRVVRKFGLKKVWVGAVFFQKSAVKIQLLALFRKKCERNWNLVWVQKSIVKIIHL